MTKGIDVSEFQGTINWEKVKPQIDFAMLRAGFGVKTVDKCFERNASECTRLGIPFGMYWFSYAISTDEAYKEATSCCDLADKYHPSYPIAFDWEYDSDNYANKHITMTNLKRINFAETFLDTVENRGYYAMLYTNPDYMGKGFSSLRDKFDIWLAHWGVSNPSYSCGIWQYSSKGKIDGISGNVDLDYSYKDYPSITASMKGNKTSSKVQTILDEAMKNYIQIAKDVIAGKYSNGDARKLILTSKGYDYNLVQKIVNALLG